MDHGRRIRHPVATYETVPGFWRAYDDNLGGDCSPYGEGRTEAEALADLNDQLDEMEEDNG